MLEEFKNNPDVALQYSNQLLKPAMSAYPTGCASISESNGSAAQDIQTLISQTETIMSNFQKGIMTDAKNVLAISDAIEAMDSDVRRSQANVR